MTGFKDGASGDDPLGGDADEDTAGEDEEPARNRGDSVTDTEAMADSDSGSAGRLPWIYRRSGITDGREKTVQLHLQQTTLDTERETLSDIEGRLGESVNKADLREAAYRVGLRNQAAILTELREWGYDMD